MSQPLKRAVLLHQQIVDPKAQDQLDTLIQIKNVDKTLIELGYLTKILEFNPDSLDMLFFEINNFNPGFVFNLVEMEGKFLHLAPTMLEFYGIPYSGCSSDSIYSTTNKVLTKILLRQFDLPTSDWYDPSFIADSTSLINKAVIVKSILEDASINIDDSSVGVFDTKSRLDDFILSKSREYHDNFFAEEYIDGREFNLSIIGAFDNPIILPIAEMQFIDFPADKVKIVSYAAKWDESTFEYQNTVRSFDFKNSDKKLIDELKSISLKCWKVFGLNGYARIDFRVDKLGNPWILEINANPGISKDSGFVAAAEKSGLNYKLMIEVIIDNLRKPK